MFLVDAGTFDCVETMPPPFLADARAALGDSVKQEIISSMIEIATQPHSDLACLAVELVSLRQALARVASAHGLALLACGTHPFSDWRRQTMTSKPRYDSVATTLGDLARRVHVCGLHVHVAVPDPATRISIMNRTQRFLPLLLALSTSSPFWRGASTGLKSYRSAANDETPRTGLPVRFENNHEFERYVEKMTAAGFIEDQSFLWWAIRPSLKYPTLELRVADCCTDWRDAIAIAAIYRVLIAELAAVPDVGARWEPHHYLVNQENRWQAIRHGLDANVLDPDTSEARPVREAIAELVAWLMPRAEAMGCERGLDHVSRILQHGTSAERQTATFETAKASGSGDREAVRRVAADIATLTLAA